MRFINYFIFFLKTIYANISPENNFFKVLKFTIYTSLTNIRFSIKNCFKKNNISFEHLDINIIKPLDINVIIKSVKKAGRLLILDNTSNKICSLGNDIISQIISYNKGIFRTEPVYLALPDIPAPTSFYLTKNYYHSEKSILNTISKILKKKIKFKEKLTFHDIPGKKFQGPF